MNILGVWIFVWIMLEVTAIFVGHIKVYQKSRFWIGMFQEMKK